MDDEFVPTPFVNLITGLKEAVVQAAREMEHQQLRTIHRYFDWVEDNDTAEEGVEGGRPPPALTAKSSEGHWTPKLARFDLPVEDGPGGPRVKEIFVPLISMVPQSALVIDEVRLVTEVELSIDSDSEEERGLLGGLTTSDSRKESQRTMLVEITIRGEELAEGYDTLVRAYSHSVKQQVPN